MTKEEVLRALPSLINHPIRGKGFLKATEDIYGNKCMVYDHYDHPGQSYSTVKQTWQEIYYDLGSFLTKKGYKVDGLKTN